MDLFREDQTAINKLVSGFSFDDAQTKAAIEEVYRVYNYVVCPHTAIAYLALDVWQKQHPQQENTGVFLATAHPCKFPDVFSDEIAAEIEIPEQVLELEGKPRKAGSLGVDYASFKAYLLAEEKTSI